MKSKETRKSQMLENINQRCKKNSDYMINYDRKNEKNDTKGNFNYTKYFNQPNFDKIPIKNAEIIQSNPQ